MARGIRGRLGLSIALVALSACGGGAAPGAGITSATPDAGLAGSLGSAVAQSGTLLIATDASEAPDEFIAADGHTIVGMEADLATALAQVLGLKAQLVNTLFARIVQGVASHRYDLGISSMAVTAERRQSADFVAYFRAGLSVFVNATNGPHIASLSDLCGHRVAVESQTDELLQVRMQDDSCRAKGRQGVTVDPHPDEYTATLALTSGHDDACVAPYPVAAYQVQQWGGQLVLSTTSFSGVYGIVLPKGSALEPAVVRAMNDLISSGLYAQILGRWGLQAGAVTTSAAN